MLWTVTCGYYGSGREEKGRGASRSIESSMLTHWTYGRGLVEACNVEEEHKLNDFKCKSLEWFVCLAAQNQ